MSETRLRVPTADDLRQLHQRIAAFYADAGHLCHCQIDGESALRTRQLRNTLHAILLSTTTLKDAMLPFRRACAQLSNNLGVPDSSASWCESAFDLAYGLLAAVDPHCHEDPATEPPPIDLADLAVQQTLVKLRSRLGGEFKAQLRSRLAAELATALSIPAEDQAATTDDATLDDRAVAVKVAHPDWPDERVASEIGCRRETLFKPNMLRYKQAKAALKAGRKKYSRDAKPDRRRKPSHVDNRGHE